MKVIAPGDIEIELGTLEVKPTIGIIDYSRRVTDDFGVTTVVRRGFARRMSVRFALPFDQADAVQRNLADLRATPAQWVADDEYDWLNFEGFYKDFSIDLAVPPLSFCTLTVEGLAEMEAGVDAGGDPAPAGATSSLLLVDPVAVTTAMLSASNIAEDDYPEWSGAAVYPFGARVIKAATHRIYESAASGNAGNDPAGSSGRWIDIGPTNRWAMFDQALGTASSRSGGITLTISPGAVDALALLDVTGSTVRVQVDGYDQTQAVSVGAMTFLDLPGLGGAITVTISGVGTVDVGTLLVGQTKRLGITGESPSTGINDFSRKEVDDFGEATVVQRAWAKRMTAQALIETGTIDDVANRIAAVRGRPALWIADEPTDSLTIYGFFKDFSIEVGDVVSHLAITVEGLSEAMPLPEDTPTSTGGALFIQSTAPSDVESRGGDLWQDDNGRYWTRRSDTRLAVGGDFLTIGGDPITVTWTPNSIQPVVDSVEDALAVALAAVAAAETLALDAQATADGKVQSFYQASAPTAASVGDLWFDTDDGNKQYRWSASAWVAVQDGGIGAALTAAAGAQATADGKVTTFVGEGTPTAEGDGDLWFKPSTKELRRWSASGGSWGDPLADLTAAAQVTIVPAVTQTINRDHTGAPKSGQLPRILIPTVTRGGADFRTNDLISYSVTATGGCEGHVSVNNTAGHADKGKVTVAATMTGPGTVLLAASVGGVSQGSFSTKVEVKDDDPPPASGGGSSQSTSNLLSTNSTTQANLMQAPTYLEVNAGSAGQIALAATLQYSADFVEIGGYDLYIQWQKWNGSAWVNIGTEQSASPVAYKEPGEGDQWDGSISASFTDTGLTPSTSYRYRLVGRIIGKTSRQRHPYGVCSATGS